RSVARIMRASSFSRRSFGLVVGAALVGHVLLALWAYPHPIFDKYPMTARAVLGGQGITTLSDVSPLYLVLHLLVGARGPWIRVLQSSLGVLSVLAVARVCDGSVSRVAAWAGGLAMAFSGSLIRLEATLEPDALVAATAVLSVWTIVCGQSRNRMLLGGV